tara:strand:- start:741 stop:1511 length:771 start_codon:yes stop_codon:yes gene_type:complete
MIDSHCHLDHEPLYVNLDEILSRSKTAGIDKLLTICTTISSYKNILKIVEFDPIIYGTFGIHPHESAKDIVTKKIIKKHISINKKIIGVGETGLDFYYNNSNKESQILSFKKHIEASIELQIPLIVHSRSAETETYEILKMYKDDNLKILMHCFTGSSNFANNLIKLNAFFSASGIITFKNSLNLQKTFSEIPLDKILIETDSPFLAPEPMRGKKNEPSFIKFTLEKLAEIKKIKLSEADKITSKNFNNLFFNNAS